MEKNTKFSGYKIAVACFVIMFVHMGALGCMGVFMPHIASNNGLEIGRLSLMVSLATGAAAVASIVLAAPLMKLLTPKWLIFVISFFIAGHFIGFSFSRTYAQNYICGTIGGVCIALGTTGAISNILGEWFIEKRAAVIGIVVGGASFGTAVFQAIGGVLIDSIGYRTTYQIMAAFVFVIAIVVNLCFVRTPKQLGQKPLGWREDSTGQASEAVTGGVTLSQAVRSPAFYLIFVGVVFGGVAWTGFKTFMTTMLLQYGYSTIVSANYSAFMNAMAAVMIIAGGFLAQKMGNVAYMVFLYATCFVGCLIIFLTGSSISTILLCVAIILGASSTCSVSALPPTICTEAFGNKDYGRIIVFVLAAGYAGQALSSIIANGLLGKGWTWNMIYMAFGVCAVAALVFYLIGRSIAPYRRTMK